MATQSELAQIQHILGKRRNLDQNPLDLSARKKSREYLDSHKDVEKRRRDRINTCLDTIRTLVPLCHQLPRHRRVDKADLLDLAIIYLRMVNQFLEKIGVSDIFSAAHQQVALFTSLEKFVKDQGEKHTSANNFSKEVLGFIEREMETVSRVIASHETSGMGAPRMENGLKQNAEWLKNEDDYTTPRSFPSSCGSDEERSVNYHGDREDRSSCSEDSNGLDFSANAAAANYYKKCNDAYNMKEPEGMYPACGVEHNGSMRSSLPSGCYSTCPMLTSRKDPETIYVDKSVNTDVSSNNFTLPPDSTFSLPILSGEIVLHTSLGPNGSFGLNAPVGVHAEIRATPRQHQHDQPAPPCQSCKQCPGSYHAGSFNHRQAPQVNTLPAEPTCVPPCSSKHKSSKTAQFSPASHIPGDLPYSPSLYPSGKTHFEIKGPGPQNHPHKCCTREIERQNPPSYFDEAYCSDEQEAKSYAPLMPLRQSREERDPVPQSPQALVTQHSPNPSYNGRKNAPFTKRYLAGIGQVQESNNNDNAGRNIPKTCSCCPNASSSLKLKSLMVHRHQAQHEDSR